MFLAFAQASLPQWLQAIATVVAVAVAMASMIISLMTYRRGVPSKASQSAQPHITTTKPSIIRDSIRLLKVNDFWPQLALFVLASVALWRQSVSTEPLTRFVVLLMVLSGALALICLAWLVFRATMYFGLVALHREMDAKHGPLR